MIEADCVLSTPPLNTSSIQETNPPLEARAESVDSFSHQPGIRLHGSRTIVSDSPRPAERLSRRNVLVGLAAIPSIPVVLRAVAAEPDPIFAAIERHKQAGAVWDAAVDVRSNFNDLDMSTDEQWEQRDELDDAVEDAWRPCEQAGIDLVNTEPTTQAGILAAIAFIQIQMLDDGTYMPYSMEFEYSPGSEGDSKHIMAWIDAFLHTIARATAALAGKAVLS
jgi:hypothetical protein